MLDGIGINVHTDADHPMRVRYRNVGLELDLSGGGTPWYETISLVYDDVSLEVEDPGSWTIDGVLGDVLRVVATRAGAGSTWVEVDLEFLVDLGVVHDLEVHRAGDDRRRRDAARRAARHHRDRRRAGHADRLRHAGDRRRRRVPRRHRRHRRSRPTCNVGAALAFEPETGFFFLEVKAILPVGIPLGPSGLGLYGFVGRFVTNGTRTVGTDERDLVARELGWYRTAPGVQVRTRTGTVGARARRRRRHRARHRVLVQRPRDVRRVVPGPERDLQHRGEVPVVASGAVRRPGEGDGASGQITGLAVIDTDAVVIAVDGSYTLPDVIDLRVPGQRLLPGVGRRQLRADRRRRLLRAGPATR